MRPGGLPGPGRSQDGVVTPRAPRSRALLTALGTVALLTLAGCGGTPVVDRADLEDDVAATLAEQSDTSPGDVSCPDDLTGEVGETVRCAVAGDTGDVPVEVRVTEVDGSDVSYDIAPTLLESTVEQEVSDQLEAQVGTAPDEIDCPDDLVGRVEEEMRCVLRAGEDELGVTLTVTEVEGQDVRFDIEVDQEPTS